MYLCDARPSQRYKIQGVTTAFARVPELRNTTCTYTYFFPTKEHHSLITTVPQPTSLETLPSINSSLLRRSLSGLPKPHPELSAETHFKGCYLPGIQKRALPPYQQTHALHVDQKPVLLFLLLHENTAVFLKRWSVPLQMILLFLVHNHSCGHVEFARRLGEKGETARLNHRPVPRLWFACRNHLGCGYTRGR